jgi:hypothetical protein
MDKNWTEISQNAMRDGSYKNAHGITKCLSCSKKFYDGVEGNADDPRCDSCWSQGNAVPANKVADYTSIEKGDKVPKSRKIRTKRS